MINKTQWTRTQHNRCKGEQTTAEQREVSFACLSDRSTLVTATTVTYIVQCIQFLLSTNIRNGIKLNLAVLFINWFHIVLYLQKPETPTQTQHFTSVKIYGPNRRIIGYVCRAMTVISTEQIKRRQRCVQVPVLNSFAELFPRHCLDSNFIQIVSDQFVVMWIISR